MIYVPASREELFDLICDLTISLADIDTSKIIDMNDLFRFSIRTDFTGLEKWDVSNVKSMSGMFRNTCPDKINISNWNVSNVEDMSFMFCGSKFNSDISKWNVSNVRFMYYMFAGSEFNQDISSWDLSNVELMFYMFADSKFNQDLNSWNVSNVRDMASIFSGSNMTYPLNKWMLNKKCCFDNFVFNRVRPIDLDKCPPLVKSYVLKHADEVLVGIDETFSGTIVEPTDDELNKGFVKKKPKKSSVISHRTLRDGTIEIVRYRDS